LRNVTITMSAVLLLLLGGPQFEMPYAQPPDTVAGAAADTISPRALDAAPPAFQIELVESVPVETELDQEDLRDAAEVWVEMMERAQASIDLAEFYLSNNEGGLLEPVIQAVVAAAGRGVGVRLLAEKSFYDTYPETIDRLRDTAGIDVRLFDIKPTLGGVHHAKYFIVDSREFFLGSQNFDWRALEHIHEIGLRVVSPDLALTLGRIFESDWALAGDEEPMAIAEGLDQDGDGLADDIDPAPATPTRELKPADDVSRAYLVASPPELNPPGIPAAEDELVRLIGSAEQQIMIQLLSYSPTDHGGRFYPAIDNALRDAASRGVQIRMILSDWNKRKPGIQYLKSLNQVPNIQIRLSTIPQWSGGFIPFARVEHCKYMVIDRKILWVGTSNWSRDYFHNSRNVEMVVESEPIAQRLWKIFYGSWHGPYVYVLRPDIDYPPPKTQ